MVNTSMVTTYDWTPFRRHTVGFDNMLNLMDKFIDNSAIIPNYPPYNIYKVNGNKYCIELAVAGFGEKDVEVKYADDTLTIKGHIEEKDKDSIIHHGIANRNFTRTFNIADDVIVKGGSLKHGVLSIDLEKIIPDEKKERVIKIST